MGDDIAKIFHQTNFIRGKKWLHGGVKRNTEVAGIYIGFLLAQFDQDKQSMGN